MINGRWIRWCVGLCLAVTLITPAAANHEETEPSDGTVASFIPVDPPQALQSVSFFKNGTEAQQLSDYRGKLLLVNIWATWCPPCLRELPALDRLQQRMGSERFQVLPIATDLQGAAVVKPYYEQLNIEHLGLYISTQDEMGKTFPVDVYPASFFIDPQGRVLSFLRSFADWDAPEADEMIRSYLQAHPAKP